MIRIGRYVGGLVLSISVVFAVSCSAQKVVNNTLKISGYKSFTINVDEVTVIDTELEKLIDGFLVDASKCENFFEKKTEKPVYVQIEEFELDGSIRLAFSAWNCYSVTYDVDEEMNRLVELNFNPQKMTKFKDYYVSFSSYLDSSSNTSYFSGRINDTGESIEYKGEALIDEMGDWVLCDTKKIEKVFEIGKDFSLFWLFDLSCNE